MFKDNYASEYEKVLNSKREEIEYLKSTLPDDYNAVKFIIYFLQPIEIEAFAHGLYAEARKKANVEYKQYRKQFNPTKKITKDKLTKDYFSKAAMRQRDTMLKMREFIDITKVAEAEAGKVNPIDDKSKQTLIRLLMNWPKVYDYAFERFSINEVKMNVNFRI